MQIVIITGISGSGKSVALNALEDAGYFCVDNLPPVLLHTLVNTSLNDEVQKLAVAVDSRSARSLAGLPDSVQQLKNEGLAVSVLFLTANTPSLIARYSETRRSHPLSHRMHHQEDINGKKPTLIEAIHKERELLVDIQAVAHVIDTSNINANKLRNWVRELIESGHASLTLHFESFGFKFGIPLDTDIMFDVRALPNPHYDPLLRPLTGRDTAVSNFLQSQPEVAELLHDIQNFIEKWLHSFKKDNRSTLTIALGCTGGQHRSVYMIEQLAAYFRKTETVLVRHRELL